MLNITQYEQLEKAYGKTLREIASDSDSWKRFLDSAGYTYRQSFKNQVAMYSQKPGMKAVLTEKRWEDMNRAVKSGTTGVRIFDDKSPNHISYVFDYADTVPGSPPPGPRPWTVHKNKTGIALHNLLKRTGEKNLDNYVQNRVRMIVDSEVDPGAEPAVRAALQRCLEQSAMYVTCVRLGLPTERLDTGAFSFPTRYRDNGKVIQRIGTLLNHTLRACLEPVRDVAYSMNMTMPAPEEIAAQAKQPEPSAAPALPDLAKVPVRRKGDTITIGRGETAHEIDVTVSDEDHAAIAAHLYAFDAWAANFGETVSAMELAPEGTGYRMKTRFARFNNLPELISMWKLAADVQTADMLKLEVPELEGGKPTVIMCPPTELQKHTIQALGERAEAVRAGSVDPHMDNMLKITTDGRKLALDQRLLNPALPDDPGSKANACADKVYEIWAQTREQRSTQLIFSDLATPGTGAWNVYDDIRDKLIARGVPKEEIAYIHDANTDAKKAALFARVRAGKVRVLLGSTQKMGAGTNVQTKLIALHHLDVPWRPSDIEQREGRILRQGNENKRVQIFRYATEGSFDAYSWQLIENKQRYISQIMTSKTPARSCEDLDEATLTYAEVKALCAGNPLIKEKMDLDNEVARLSTLRSAHNAQIYELQDLVSIGYPAAIRRIGQELDALRQDAALFQSSLRKDDKGNEMFSAVIQGVTYTKRADADAALLEACKAAAAGAGEKKIGRYCGFDICVGYDPKIIGFAGYLQGEQRYRIELNPKQNFSSFRAVLENISAQIPVKIAAREEIEKNIESAKEAAKQPFAYEEEFQTKLARLNELNILLDQEKQELVQNEKENRMQKENVNLHAEENEDWEASTVEPAAKLPAGWKWTMYSDGSGRLEGPDKQSLYSYDRMTYASAGEIEYRKSNNSSWDVFPEGSLDRFREWAEQQLLQELKKEPLQYQEFLEHQSHQDDEIEKNPLDMEDAARQAGLTVQRDQDKPGAAYFDADQNVIHVSDAGSEEDVRLSELKGYADAVIQRTATVEQPVRDLESASLAVMLAARYDVGVSDRLSQQLASAHAEAVKCPTFDLPVTLQRLDKALDYCDHFLAHEQERALEQEAENEPEPEQVTELSPQSQAFMMDL